MKGNKIMDEYISRLMLVFEDSFINHLNELILVPNTNLYFSLNDVKNELDIKCKLLEWCSRDAVKAKPYNSYRRNEKYQDSIRNNINEYLKTNFTREDMEIIYCELGNAISHSLTIDFIKSNYDINLLKGV